MPRPGPAGGNVSIQGIAESPPRTAGIPPFRTTPALASRQLDGAISIPRRLCGTSRCCAGSFTKLVAGNVENGEASSLLWKRLEIGLDKNLDRLFAGIDLDTNRR